MPDSIQSDVKFVIELYRKDSSHRFRSWEHCFKTFRPGNSAANDILALHLAFYLASWGMYRGSTFLLQKDFTIHRPAVALVTKPEWADLYDIEACKIPRNLSRIIALGQEIKSAYHEAIRTSGGINGRAVDPGVSDTLITKVLLGTLGCAPAYDQYLRQGSKAYQIDVSHFTEASMKKLVEFYGANEQEFEDLRTRLKADYGIEFTAMKILDACLWGRGYRSHGKGKGLSAAAD